MDEIKRFTTIAERNKMGNELYVFGVIQGLMMGICDPDCKTFRWDCEIFQDFCIFTIDTTQERFDRFRSFVEKIYPGLCKFSTTVI